MTATYRPDLPPRPERMARLPLDDRGFPMRCANPCAPGCRSWSRRQPRGRGAPTAAWIGDCAISKWRNLSKKEKDGMDAMIHDMGRGRFRGGAVEVAVYVVTPAMDAWLAQQAEKP